MVKHKRTTNISHSGSEVDVHNARNLLVDVNTFSSIQYATKQDYDGAL